MIDSGETLIAPADRKCGWFVALAFFAVLLPRALVHVMWRDEWQSWLLASDHCSFTDLFARVRYEGHPSGWYTLLWFSNRIWADPIGMKVLHSLIAAGVAYVIGAYGPWPRWQRVLLMSGYFFAFEYAVVSRNYAMGVLPLFAFAAIQARRPQAYIASGICLAIAVNANAFAAVLSGCLALWLAWRWLKAGRPSRSMFFVGGGILVIGFGLALLQMRAPADRQYADMRLHLSSKADIDQAGKMVAAIFRSFVPLPSPQRDWWATNFLDFTLKSGPLRVTQGLLGVVTFFAAAWMLPTRRWDIRALWLGGAVAIGGFGYVVFTGSLRHHGHYFVLFVIAAWLAGAGRPASWKNRVWTGVLIAQVATALIVSIADLIQPFSATRATAGYIAANYPNAAVIGHRDFTTTPIAGELGKPIYYPTPGRWGTFVVWDKKRNYYAEVAKLTKAAEQLRHKDPNRDVVFVMSDTTPNENLARPDPKRFREIARFADSTVEDERFTVYLFDH